jgi:hypothetical protein
VTKRTYRRLRAIWIIGSAVLGAAVVGGWFHVVPFGLFLLLIILVGGPAAFAGWVLHDQNFQELPE